jgi:ribonuclease T2
VNGSDVRKLFVDNIDREITSGEIRNEFSDAFSSGAGAKVSVECARDNEPTQRRMIQELQLNLKGEIKQNTSVADLLKTGKSVNADCPRGEVDRVGLN